MEDGKNSNMAAAPNGMVTMIAGRSFAYGSFFLRDCVGDVAYLLELISGRVVRVQAIPVIAFRVSPSSSIGL